MIDLILALGLGLAAGLHCLGMCGPIVLALQKPVMGEWRWVGNLLYNFGRISTYAIVGLFLSLALGGAKDALPAAAASKWISLGVNGFLILLGLYMILPLASTGISLPSPAKIPGFTKLARLAAGRGKLGAAFLLGLLLGLLPCGLSYAMFLRASDARHPLMGMGLCAAFGLGTAPSLLFAGVGAGLMQAKWRRWGEIVSGVIIITMGIFNIVKRFG